MEHESSGLEITEEGLRKAQHTLEGDTELQTKLEEFWRKHFILQERMEQATMKMKERAKANSTNMREQKERSSGVLKKIHKLFGSSR